MLQIVFTSTNIYIYDRIKYFIGLKSGAIYVFSYNYVKIKNDLDDFPLEVKLILHKLIVPFM